MSQLQNWIRLSKLSKYEDILIEEIGEIDVVEMLTVEDVQEIAKKAKMGVGHKRAFLLAVEKKKKSKETTKNESKIKKTLNIEDLKRVGNMLREITLKYEFEALKKIALARKLVRALDKRPNQRLKLSISKYESEIVGTTGMEFILISIGGLLKLKRDGYVYLSLKSPEIDDRDSITVELPTSLRQLGQLMDVEIEKLKLVSHAFEQRGSSTETEIARQGVRKMLREKLDTLHRAIQKEKIRASSSELRTSRKWKIIPPMTPDRLDLLKQLSETSDENKADFIEQSAKERVEIGLQRRVSQNEGSPTNTTTSTFSTTESRTINDLEQRLIDAREKMIRVQYVLPDQWKIRCEYDPFELTRNVHDHFKTWLSSLVHDDDEFEYKLVPKGKASTLVAQHFKDKETFFDLQAGNNRLRYVVRFTTKDCDGIINALEKTLF